MLFFSVTFLLAQEHFEVIGHCCLQTFLKELVDYKRTHFNEKHGQILKRS